MKLIFGLIAALAVTIAWQTSVLSEEKQSQAMQEAVEQLQQENKAAGREPLADTDCD